MKIQRLILWNFREGVSEAEKQRIVERGRAVLTNMPSVESFSLGMAVEPDVRYHYFVLVSLADQAAVAAYIADPNREAFANNEFGPQLADQMTLTYEMQP